MGESFAAPGHNAPNIILPQPTPPALVAEDDDEPPSSGSTHRPSQIISSDVVPVGYTTSSTSKTSYINVVHREKHEPEFIDNAEKLEVTVTTQRVPRAPALNVGDRFRVLFTPSKPLGPRPTYSASAKATLMYTPLNVCLVFIPVSWAMYFTHQSPTLVFVFSALGIIPLAALLGLGTEQIALRTSQSVGGLLNATLGNIVEMIIAGIALKKVCHLCMCRCVFPQIYISSV